MTTCVVCQKREAEDGQVCGGDRSGLAAVLRDLVDAYAVLGQPEPAAPVLVGVQVVDDGGWDDPRVYDVYELPGGPVRVATGSAPVSGSREAPVPITMDLVDLTAPARQGSRQPHARGVLGYDDCQTGHLSVATELETWVRDWRTYPRCPGDQMPVPDVVTMVRWLSDRLPWACDEHPALDEFAGDMRRLLATCRRAAGEQSDLKKLGPCPEQRDDGSPCGQTLFVHPYADLIECRRCGRRWDRRKQEWLWLGQLLGYDQDGVAA